MFLILASFIAAALAFIAYRVKENPDFASFKKVGGLYHWRLGRLGGSLYLKSATNTRKPRVNRFAGYALQCQDWMREPVLAPQPVEIVAPEFAAPTVSEQRIAFAMSTIRKL